jgi:ATP-binding cassette subfamily C protein LapB
MAKATAAPTLEPLNTSKADAVHWFGGTLWRFRNFYIDSMLATIMANVLTLASIFFTMNVYNRIVPTQAYVSLWTLAIGTTLAIIFEFLMRWLKARLIDIGGKKADLEINATLLQEIMTIRLEHGPTSVGIFASSMRDFDALRDFFSSASLVLVTDLPFIFLFLFLIGILGGPLVVIPALIIPILLLVGLIAQPGLTRAIRQNMKEAGDRQSVLVESVLNLELLKAHNEQRYLQARWERANLASAESYKKLRSISNMMTGLTVMLQQLTTIGMVVYGVYLIHEKDLSLGALIACVLLAGRALTPLSNVMSLATRFQQALSALDTLTGLMKRPRDFDPTMEYAKSTHFTGALESRDLEFSYPSALNVPVLKQVSVRLQPGERVALVGAVGSGKSTFLRTMAGLYTPLAGEVRVDGINLSQVDPATLRQRIGYIGQDTQLFFGTLRQNLMLSNLAITDSTVLELLKKIGLYELVAKHPRGLDMHLSEAGGGISGGQKQLVAIARMMLRDPVYVFMDEPTSHMDAQTEALVLSALEPWLNGKTVLLSSHRTQLLRLVNRVVVFERGTILGDGSREDFIRSLRTESAAKKELKVTSPVATQQARTARYTINWRLKK